MDTQLDASVTIGINCGQSYPANSIIFALPGTTCEMLRISEDGFYVRGVKLPQDDAEAIMVYGAFSLWLKTVNDLNSKEK